MSAERKKVRKYWPPIWMRLILTGVLGNADLALCDGAPIRLEHLPEALREARFASDDGERSRSLRLMTTMTLCRIGC